MREFNSSIPVVLIAEENGKTRDLMLDAFNQSESKLDLHLVDDSQSVIDYINENGIMPDLIFLGLGDEPQKNLELLERIKSNDDLGIIPIVVIINSPMVEKSDILRCYKLQAAGCIKRPNEQELHRVVKGIGDYWFTLCKLPQVDC